VLSGEHSAHRSRYTPRSSSQEPPDTAEAGVGKMGTLLRAIHRCKAPGVWPTRDTLCMI
jgi:hypothetical protein